MGKYVSSMTLNLIPMGIEDKITDNGIVMLPYQKEQNGNCRLCEGTRNKGSTSYANLV